MKWGKLFKNPLFSISGLGTCVSLLVDFQGAATKVSNTIPYIQAFIPVVAIWAGIFFSLHIVITLPGIVYSFFHSRLPGVKWGKENYASIRSLARQLDHSSEMMAPAHGFFSALVEMQGRLYKYGIECPEIIRHDKECETAWMWFLSNLANLAENHDLEGAKTLWENLKKQKERNHEER